MSLVAIAEPVRTLAEAVDELIVLVQNGAGGSCVWCGSRDLWTAVPAGDAAEGNQCLVTTCRGCGTELDSERSLLPRTRLA
jgi:hypothetical protein